MPEAFWNFELCDHVGENPVDLPIMATVRRAVGEPARITHPLDHEDQVAERLFAYLANGIPQLKAYRDGLLWARAWWHPMKEDADLKQAKMACVWRGPLGELDMHIFATEYGTYTHPNSYTAITRDQAGHAHAIACDTQLANSNTNSMDTGLFSGNQWASVTRDRFYPTFKNRAEALVQLSEVIDGVVVLERPIVENTISDGVTTRVALARLDAGGPTAFGNDKTATVIFEYDGALDNCVSASREIGRPVNNVIALGADWEASDGRVYRFSSGNQNHQASIDKYRIQRRILELPDVKLVATLTEHAQGAWRPDPPQTVTFEPQPTGDLQPHPEPSAPNHYWLRDTARFIADRANLQIDTTARISAIEIDTNATGGETAHRLEFGEQRSKWPLNLLRPIERRISALAKSASA